MKYILFALIAICLPFTIRGQNTSDELVNNFLTEYGENRSHALDSLFSTNKLFPYEKIQMVKSKLQELVSQIGEYHGFEIIQKHSAGDCMVQYYVILKYDRQPIKFVIIFYKPKDIWWLYNYKFDSDVDEDLERSAKITLFIDK